MEPHGTALCDGAVPIERSSLRDYARLYLSLINRGIIVFLLWVRGMLLCSKDETKMIKDASQQGRAVENLRFNYNFGLHIARLKLF